MPVKGVSQEETARYATLKPSHFSLQSIVRPNILALNPYVCARDEYTSGILLDANENSIGHAIPRDSSLLPKHTGTDSYVKQNGDSSSSASSSVVQATVDPLALNRYPDPGLFGVKTRLSELRGVPNEDHVFLGVGSDEILDLIQRIVGTPGKDAICICPPTYGMYDVCAAVNDLEVVRVPLNTEDGDFSLDVDALLSTLRSHPNIKLLFLCSPGNPTGTLLNLSDIRRILDEPAWNGLVVVDEAYIDFAEEEISLGVRANSPVSAVSLLGEYKNLIVTQTLSKAYGLAGIRLGIAYAQPPLIQIMNNTKAPYNISVPTAHLASLALSPTGLKAMKANMHQLLTNRSGLIQALITLPCIGDILGSNDANFVLVQILSAPTKLEGGKPDSQRAAQVYKAMAEQHNVVVRNRSKDLGCDGCLRITVGTKEENDKCIALLRQLLSG